MTVAEARASCAGLRCEPHDLRRDLHALESLGRWLMRYTPDVALDPPDALLLNVGGGERLFGGFDVLLSSVQSDLRRLGIHVQIALAPTGIAAWALATHSPSIGICPPEHLPAALAPLPVAALRFEPEISEKFRQLAVRTIGQITALPRDALPARFGAAMGVRLDLAYGRRPEIFPWLPHRSAVRQFVEYEDGVRSFEGIRYVLEELIRAACADLARRGCGARLLRVGMRDDGGINGGNAGRHWTWTDVALARPSRKPAVLIELVRCATEDAATKRANDCYTAFEVTVPLFCPIDQEQIDLLDQDRQETDAERERLIGRLEARLGSGAVARPQPIESHLPELACVDRRVDRQIDSDPAARSVHEAKPNAVRPLHLLPMPTEVPVVVEPSDTSQGRPRQMSYKGRIHLLVHVKGPERIAGEWWRGHNKTRDYFDVLDERGLRFWLFRVTTRIDEDRYTTRWFLHGRFA